MVDAECGEGTRLVDQEEVLRSRGAHGLCFVPHEIRGNYGAPVVGLTRVRALRTADKLLEDLACDSEQAEGRADTHSGRVEHAGGSLHGEATASGERCFWVEARCVPQRRVHGRS